MKNRKITIGGKEYPCRLTMGALVRYKNETGEDVSKLREEDLSGQMMFIYCCVKSACNADGVAFDYDFESFCDLLEPEDVRAFYAGMDEKKTQPQAVTKRT